jgi:hypothetical protein
MELVYRFPFNASFRKIVIFIQLGKNLAGGREAGQLLSHFHRHLGKMGCLEKEVLYFSLRLLQNLAGKIFEYLFR